MCVCMCVYVYVCVFAVCGVRCIHGCVDDAQEKLEAELATLRTTYETTKLRLEASQKRVTQLTETIKKAQKEVDANFVR